MLGLLCQNTGQKKLQEVRVSVGSQLEGPVHHGGDVLAVGTGGSWSDLIASTIRIQREMNADAQFMVSFSFSLGPQPMGGAAYHEGESFHLC